MQRSCGRGLRHLAQSSCDCVVQETGRRVSRLAGHTAEVTDAALTDDGMLAATCSADNSLRVWDTPTGPLLLGQ